MKSIGHRKLVQVMHFEFQLNYSIKHREHLIIR